MAKGEMPISAKGAQPKRLVAIVTPLTRFPLAEDEEISMHHLREYLGHFDRFIIGPKDALRSLHETREYSDFALRQFPDRYFQSIQSYSRLMVTEEFYRAFTEYEYILIYQLDCLVFSSDLEAWCHGGWDYIGAPLFKDFLEDPAAGPWVVGNGGLSLRRVGSALDVLTSARLLDDPKVRGPKTRRFKSAPYLRRMLVALRTFLFERGYHNTVGWLLRKLKKHPEIYFQEDLFWAVQAPRLAPGFNIATPEQALGFSFEMAPRYCFQANSSRLPFGCHAWAKHDRGFWEPFLLK
ncbi:MAG: DUF5672 family protein [Candidatus Acidiferrales bacterium]